MSQTSLNWKHKAVSPQGGLPNNEIKEKVLQFRSPKYGNVHKTSGIIHKNSAQLLQESSPKKAV